MEKTMEKIVALSKSRGFIFPGSEIYGGLANTWDYGPLGVELKNNVKKAWWQKFVQESPYNVGLDCAILMNPQTWVASGHLGSFSDPLMDCKECHERFRADKLIEDYAAEQGITLTSSVDGWSNEEMEKFVEEHQIPCPSCGKHNFTGIRQFNLMFKTFQGVTEDAKNTVYLLIVLHLLAIVFMILVIGFTHIHHTHFGSAFATKALLQLVPEALFLVVVG